MALTKVNSGGVKDDSIVNADIKSDAAIAGTKISPDFGSQNIVTTGEMKISNAQPGMVFEDTGANPDFVIQNRDGSFAIRDTTNNANRFLVNMANGAITGTGDTTLSGHINLEGGSTNYYPYIEFHSSAPNVRKWRILGGQVWNPDALLIYDIDEDSTALTIETNKLGVNRGASSLTHAFEVGGDASITGNLIIATSGKGIDFSATSNASGKTSELFDDYEEGTWTPNVGSGGTIASITSARYTKIGRMVHYSVYMSMGTSTSTSAFSIGGLPFTAGNASQYFYGTGRVQNATSFVWQVDANSNGGTMYATGGSVLTFQTASNNYVLISGVYEAT